MAGSDYAPGTGQPRQQATPAEAGLTSSAQLMVFEPGLYQVAFGARRSVKTDIGIMLPSVRLDPISASDPGAGRAFVSMSVGDGWMSQSSDQAFILVAGGPARVILTIYKAGPDMPAPEIRITHVTHEALAAAGMVARAGAPRPAVPTGVPLAVMVHSTGGGDIRSTAGEWTGKRGSTIEGFALALVDPAAAGADPAGPALEYQAIMGEDWNTPWFRAGEFCGSRGLSLALLGYRIRLSEALAQRYSCVYWGTFRGGSPMGPFRDGEACLSGKDPLEALMVVLEPRPPAVAPPQDDASPLPEPEVAPAPRRRKTPR